MHCDDTSQKDIPFATCFYYTFCLSRMLVVVQNCILSAGQSALIPPTLYFPRWSDRGSTYPSIARCLDSLPLVHNGADPRPPSCSLYLPSGRCRCCSPPRPGEGPTGVCSLIFFFFLICSLDSGNLSMSLMSAPLVKQYKFISVKPAEGSCFVENNVEAKCY